jgi:hypothetical protein
MAKVVQSAWQAWRTMVGREPAIARLLGQPYRWIRGRMARTSKGDNFITFWSHRARERRIGIYLRGSCDLVSIFFCQPLIQQRLRGTCCILREGLASDSRSDLLLQTLQDFPQEWLEPVMARLKLPIHYFQPRFFEKSFAVERDLGREEFPKTVICLSIASDVSRTVYRHRQHGFLVDPGEWWLKESTAKVLGDLPTVMWFWENFVSIGKLSVEDFAANFARVIALLKQNTAAQILVFNTLTDDSTHPSEPAQDERQTQMARRRVFNAKLEELSRQLGFHIVDVDRILKRAGLGMKGNAIDFPPEREEPTSHEAFRAIAHEAFRMMGELGVFEERSA